MNREIPSEQYQLFEDQETHEKDRGKELREFYTDKFKHGHVGALVKVLLSEPVTEKKMYQLLNDKEVFTENGIDLNLPEYKVTMLASSLMRDPSFRELYISAIERDMQEQTLIRKQELAKVKPLMDNGDFHNSEVLKTAVHNRLVVGGGVHSSIFYSRLTQETLDSKNVTVTAENSLSRSFKGKEFLKINSKTSQHTEQVPSHLLKTGDLNTFGTKAPMQLSFFATDAFPSADKLAQTATVNQSLSNSEVMMGTRVARIISRGEETGSEKWPAENKVVYEDGMYEFSDEVLLSTAFGDVELPRQFDQESRDIFIRDSVSKNPDTPPGMMTYESFGEFLSGSETPLRHFKGKSLDIAGGGDSGATVIEVFLRLSAEKVYGLDVVQSGTVQTIHWDGVESRNAAEYKRLLQNDRYLMVAMDMPLSDEDRARLHGKEIEKKIDPIHGYLVQVRDSDKPELGRYRVQRLVKTKHDDGTESESLQEGYTDFVIVTAGYSEKMGKLFGEKNNPFDDHAKAEAVTGHFDELGADLPVAVKLKGKKVYAMGPSSISQVLVDAESTLSGSAVSKKGHIVSIAMFSPRTEKLAEILGKEKVQELPRMDYVQPVVEMAELPGSGTYVGKRLNPDSRLPVGKLLEELQAKAEIAKVFEQCNFKNFDAESLEIRVSKRFVEEGGKRMVDKSAIDFTLTPNLTNADKLIECFQNSGLVDMFVSQLEKTRWDLKVTIPFFKRGGSIKAPELNLEKVLK